MKDTDQLSLSIRVTLFTKNWYNKVIGFIERKTDKERARQLTGAAFSALWKQDFISDPTKGHCWYLFFIWLYIESELNPNLKLQHQLINL